MTEATSDTFPGFKCPECATISSVDEEDCPSCDYGAEEEGWETVTAYEALDGTIQEQ